jgi:hypothetical protein
MTLKLPMKVSVDFPTAVMYLHPGVSMSEDVVLYDKGDGPMLAVWNLPGDPPTDAEVAAAMAAIVSAGPLPDLRSLAARITALETK